MANVASINAEFIDQRQVQILLQNFYYNYFLDKMNSCKEKKKPTGCRAFHKKADLVFKNNSVTGYPGMDSAMEERFE